MGVLPRPSIPAESHHTEERLTEDAARHLTRTLATVDEDDAHLLDLESNLIGCVFHLYLETIALETNLIRFDGFQHATLVALEACRGVVYLKSRDETHLFRGEITHQHPSDGPVDDIHTTDIATTDGQVVTLVVTSTVESWQVVGVVTEVGIHFEDIFVVVF